MKIYLRKLLQHDITHQISVTKEIIKDFFGVSRDKDSVSLRGKKSGFTGNLVFNLATDPRFGGGIKRILDEEGGADINDILLFSKIRNGYTVDVIKLSDSRYKTIAALMENDRHLIVNTDDENELYQNGNDDNDLNQEHNSSTAHNENKYARNRIIFGAPGTGKSFTLNSQKNDLLSLPEDCCGSCEQYERVTFHPDYSYANFVGTYKPIPFKDENNESSITYEYVPGPFMRLYIKAMKNLKTNNVLPYLLIVEEINRANAAAVFGDVFQLLDRNELEESDYPIRASEELKQYLSKEDVLGGKPEDYDEIKIPNNMYIWATMNSADQGVFPMDTAFKRRWDFTYIGVNESADKIKGYNYTLPNGVKVNWNELREAINARLSALKVNEDKLLGPFFISEKILKSGDEAFNSAFKNKVLMYLFEDAGKQKRNDIFDTSLRGAGDVFLYSLICEGFDRKGTDIFNSDIRSRLTAVQSDSSEEAGNE